jgi:hypothetical protein
MAVVAITASSVRIVALPASFALLIGTVTIPPFLVAFPPEIVLPALGLGTWTRRPRVMIELSNSYGVIV